jgi:hypothetical protein
MAAVGLTSVAKCAHSQIAVANLRRHAKERNETIRAVLKLLAQKPASPAETEAEAIVLLGDLRAEEAVDLLVSRVTFIDPRPVSEVGMSSTYPAVGALIRIGYPAVQGILRRGFLKERTIQEQKLMAYVIRVTLGDRIARAVVEEQLARLRTQDREKSRLTEFRDMYIAGKLR